MKFYTDDAGVTFFRVTVKTETARWTKYWLPESATFETLKRYHVNAQTVRGDPHVLADYFWGYLPSQLSCVLSGTGRVADHRLVLPALIDTKSKWVSIGVLDFGSGKTLLYRRSIF